MVKNYTFCKISISFASTATLLARARQGRLSPYAVLAMQHTVAVCHHLFISILEKSPGFPGFQQHFLGFPSISWDPGIFHAFPGFSMLSRDFLCLTGVSHAFPVFPMLSRDFPCLPGISHVFPGFPMLSWDFSGFWLHLLFGGSAFSFSLLQKGKLQGREKHHA